MKKSAEILKEIGFKPDSCESVKEAFVRHLVRSIPGNEVAPRLKESTEKKAKLKLNSSKQMSFDFSNEFQSHSAPNKKSA